MNFTNFDEHLHSPNMCTDVSDIASVDEAKERKEIAVDLRPILNISKYELLSSGLIKLKKKKKRLRFRSRLESQLIVENFKSFNYLTDEERYQKCLCEIF